MPLWMLRNRAVFAPDGSGAAPVAAPADAAPAAAPADTGSILYPGDQPASAPATETTAAPAGDEWKEFTPDPAKSEEENAAAKAEHDKTKPVDEMDKVPEDGKYQLKMPEGVEVNQALLEQLAPEFKTLGLTHKQAQALTDKYIAATQAEAERRGSEWETMRKSWVETAQKDSEIGGAKWDTTVKASRDVVRRFGNEGFVEYLNASGAGDHPEMIRFMAKVAAVISEDTPATANNQGTRQPRDTAEILYPDDKPKG